MGVKISAFLITVATALALPAKADEALAEAVTDYMDFATYEQGITLPAQIDEAVFAARLMGRENLVVLQSGILGWTADAAYQPE